jgi:hypothetical protein
MCESVSVCTAGLVLLVSSADVRTVTQFGDTTLNTVKSPGP